jgi:hypothetical protein
MKFLGDVCFKFPCPDHETVNYCRGKIAMPVESYRIARGRDAFALTVPERVQCDECGKVFKVTPFSSQAENHIIFEPIGNGQKGTLKLTSGREK